MGVFSYLRKVYDVDTLDTRFTAPSNVAYKTVLEQRSDPVARRETEQKNLGRSLPSKWNTPEFYLYYVVFLFAVPSMFWICYDVSRPSDPRYYKFQDYLSDGWVPGRKIDNSDAQYHSFRGNLPAMAALLVFHPILRRVWDAVNNRSDARKSAAANRMEQRASFDFLFGILFVVILYGVSIFKILAILYVNYQVATKLPRHQVPAATWIFNICVLFANELGQGYPLKGIAQFFSPASASGEPSELMQLGSWIDSFGGIMVRWEVLFNLTVLRLISFNLDYYWAVDKKNVNSVEKQLDPANLSERDRISIPADVQDYSFRNYVGYAIYAPLFIAGPIMTFNDYISQIKYRSATIETSRTIKYAVRFALVLLAMELVLHFDYVGAISKANPVWGDYTAAQLSMLSFMNLHIIWLKLLLPWRFFRLWALVDGIDPPENMTRCVSNNYSTQHFWRAWHRSFNRWIIRYVYIPLGGTSFKTWRDSVRSIATFLTVFTFVALWHDIQLRLLIWGWLIVLFLLPEQIATIMFPKRKWESRPTAYRMICCIGAVFNVIMMISANLVGFAVGLDGLESILRRIVSDWSGFMFIVTACSCLFVGIQVMFEIRESEKRKGVMLKC
ncbi:Putative Glycerol uptake protein [[Torrubiella] hemipterigena]|uniref:Putative Glycerol uptake protein n=1 Tax=[Torrubiella] hemipterigena TaxID=1531966 RepID=A0A0A1TC33_9HYPO|nr:Putative Glycerol uptake protein [[Torrubiella] hemipterigena]